MKRFNYLLLSLLALGLTFNSCKDDTSDEVFSPNTVEKNKTYIEDQGIAMVDVMKEMDNEPAIDASISFVNYLATGDISVSNKKAGTIDITKQNLFKPVLAIANLKNQNSKAVLKALKSATEDPQTLAALYDSLVGIYTWDAQLQIWDYNADATNIQFYFPSTETGTTNNASFIINYTGTTETYTIGDAEDGYVGDLPLDLKAELKVDDKVVFTYLFSATYDSKATPTSISTSITMGEFVFSIAGTNTNNANLTLVYTFKQGSTIIMKFELGINGNWAPENIDQEEVAFQDVINSGNASFQVLGIKAVGQVDVTNLVKKIDELDKKRNDDNTFEEDSSLVVEYMNTINQYVNLSLRYVDNNNIIAKLQVYPVFESDTILAGDVIYINWKVTMGYRFVFGDGSTIDADVYFEEGFDGLLNDWWDYCDELKAKYGEQ
jgi:hypothetical protein